MEKIIHCTYTDSSQVTIQTSAVQDILHTIHNQSGSYVTPGEMLVAALGACTLTMIGAVAQKHKHSMDGLQLELKPVFAADLSGLQQITMHLTFPPNTPPQMRQHLLAAAQKCPVHNSLNPAIQFTLTAD